MSLVQDDEVRKITELSFFKDDHDIKISVGKKYGMNLNVFG